MIKQRKPRRKKTLVFVPIKGHDANDTRTWLDVFILPQANDEIRDWPLEIKKDLGSLLTKLQKGQSLSYPDVRPMATVDKGVSEIRLKDSSGAYRAFYLLQDRRGIIVFHAFKKKSQKTPTHEIETGRLRLRAFLKGLKDGC